MEHSAVAASLILPSSWSLPPPPPPPPPASILPREVVGEVPAAFDRNGRGCAGGRMLQRLELRIHFRGVQRELLDRVEAQKGSRAVRNQPRDGEQERRKREQTRKTLLELAHVTPPSNHRGIHICEVFQVWYIVSLCYFCIDVLLCPPSSRSTFQLTGGACENLSSIHPRFLFNSISYYSWARCQTCLKSSSRKSNAGVTS